MKKLSICITCIIALVLGISGSAYSESGEWKKSEQGEKRTLYEHPDTECMVMVDTSEKARYVGMTATVSDPDDFGPGGNEGVYTQRIVVKKLPGGDILRVENYTYKLRVAPGSKDDMGYRGYDIFGSKCVEPAKELPKDVQKLFYGHYGIGGE